MTATAHNGHPQARFREAPTPPGSISGATRVVEFIRCLRVAAGQWTSRQSMIMLTVSIMMCVFNARTVSAGARSAALDGHLDTAEMLSDPGILMLMWTKGVVPFILVLMALAITRPYETGVVNAERLAVPRTWQWPLSRWVGASLTLTVSTVAAALLTWRAAAGVDAPGDFSYATIIPMALRLSGGLVAVAALVAGIACMVRNSAVVCVVVGVWYLLGEEILGIANQLDSLTAYLPLANVWYAVGFERTGLAQPGWSPSAALLYVTAIGVVVLAVGLVHTRRQ